MSTASEPTLSVFTLWAVFRRDPAAPSATAAQVDSLNAAIAAVEADGVTIRGFYDVSGMRADADLMVWMHGDNPEALQGALRKLRRTDLLKPLLPTWNAMGVNRGAEFNANHVPAFIRGLEPKEWMTVYPFVRSYEWYLLSADERSGMLARHGRLAGPFPGVLSNTVSAFALGDYEWLVPLEADVLTDLVDLMRALRAADARRHVREEIPFYTGRRIAPADIVEVLA
jgi:chlorite dismutase